jgi:hypothetical protein
LQLCSTTHKYNTEHEGLFEMGSPKVPPPP